MWSIVMEPGKKYSTIVEHTFHLSMAALDLETVKKNNDIHTIYVETGTTPRAILCHLSKASNIFQVRLDHVFPQGTNLKFFISGSAQIHMTGYLDYDDQNDDLFSDLESEAEEEEISTFEKGKKRKAEVEVGKKKKNAKLSVHKQPDKEDSDDDDEIGNSTGYQISDLLDSDESTGGDSSFLDNEASEDDDDEEDDDDDDDDDDDEEEEEDSDEVEDEPVLTKKQKEQQKTPKKQLNGNDQKTPKKDQKTPNKNQEKTPIAPKTPKTPNANQSQLNGTIESGKKKKNEPKTPLTGIKTKPDTPLPKDTQNQQQKLNGGVMIQDLKVGDGALAKPGKNIKVYYIGRLKSTGKVFDSMQKGPGFSFGLQRGEVIKGWDIGIAGMKVGGKRKVICPPNMAYGAKGSPPEIPPNSTLVFEVELKHVN